MLRIPASPNHSYPSSNAKRPRHSRGLFPFSLMSNELEGAPSFAPLFYAKGGLLRSNGTKPPLLGFLLRFPLLRSFPQPLHKPISKLHPIIEILHTHALIFPMRSLIFHVKKHAGNSERRHSRCPQIMPIRRSRGHRRHHQQPRPHSLQHSLERVCHFRQQRRWRHRHNRHFFTVARLPDHRLERSGNSRWPAQFAATRLAHAPRIASSPHKSSAATSCNTESP